MYNLLLTSIICYNIDVLCSDGSPAFSFVLIYVLEREEFHISHEASRLISMFSSRLKERSRVSREIFKELNFKMELIQGRFQCDLLIFGV